jgi:SPP1 family predicted phage head-tail adaptor
MARPGGIFDTTTGSNSVNLDKLVSIERRGHLQDSAGQTRETWQHQAQVWASIRPVAGREYYAQSGERAEVSHEIIVRHGVELEAKDRIVFDGRVFDIVSAFNLEERNRYIKAMSKENANLGL